MSDPRLASGAPRPAPEAALPNTRLLSGASDDSRRGGPTYPPEYRRETRPRLMTDADVAEVLRDLAKVRERLAKSMTPWLNLPEGYADEKGPK